MKRFVYLALAMLMPGMLLAAPVKKDAAKMKAAAFLQQKIAATSGRRAPQNLSLTSSEEEGSAYYVFKNGNKGFAIVAGDDRFGDVIGYSEENTFDEANMPEALRLTLQDYAAAVKFAQENNIEVKKGPRKAERASVTPFMEYEWNQSAPYCNQTPASGTSSHVSLGCMPVTVSMIVAHFRYPETLPAAYNGNYTNPATAYDYSKFKKSYSKYATDLDNVDMFMYHIANLLGTNYSNSSAQESALLPTLKNTLGYNPYMRTLRRDAYSAEDWEELIYTELAAGRPVNFVGSHEDLGGHSYLTDGYQASDGFFHMIWGWGSTCVGYFDINILNPFIEYISQWGGMGYNCPPAGFTQDLKAVVGIQPAATEKVASVLTVDNFSKEGTSKYRAMFFNYNAESYTGKISWAILDEGESFTLLENVQPTAVSRVTSYTYSTLDVSQLNLTEGEYKIVPVCQANDETEWNLCQGYKQKYVEIKVAADGEMTVVAHPVVDLNVDGLVYQRVTGEYIEMVLDMSNHGDDTFGSLHITGVRDDDVKVDGSHMDIAVSAGKNQMLSVFIATGGSYSGHTYEVSVEYMKKVIWKGTIDPSAYSSNYSEYNRVEFADYEYKDGNAYLYSTTLKGDVIIKSSKWYVHNLPVRLTLKDENDNIVYQETQQQYLEKDTEGRYSMNVEGLQSNKTYKLTAEVMKVTRSGSTYTESVAASFFKDFPINVRVGVPYYNENGALDRIIVTDVSSQPISLPANASAVDFRNFSSDLVDLSSISNENCLFVFPAGATVPAELNGKNVVVGGVAEKITLTDGKPVVFPVDFTATEITYARTFTNFNNGGTGGWNTIVLPFEATPTLDGANIDWFHSKNDASGRKFWLYKYTNGVGGTVYFDYASERKMQANVPYLLAVPGDKWGEKYDLHNKEFIFRGSNAAVKSNVEPVIKSGEYVFNGTFAIADCKNAYKLNEDGDFFELQTEDATELPFRAYFANADESTSNAARVLRVARSETDGIVQMESDELINDNQPIYNLNGQRMQQMQRGVNIVGGKKILKK